MFGLGIFELLSILIIPIIVLGILIYLIILASRLVKAVEKIADKYGNK